jgi:hypothetical protein
MTSYYANGQHARRFAVSVFEPLLETPPLALVFTLLIKQPIYPW